MEERIKNVMAAVFNVSPEQISDDASPHQIAAWDSLKHMNLIFALEEEFDIHFEEAEVASMVSFDIIAATIRAYAE